MRFLSLVSVLALTCPIVTHGQWMFPNPESTSIDTSTSTCPNAKPVTFTSRYVLSFESIPAPTPAAQPSPTDNPFPFNNSTSDPTDSGFTNTSIPTDSGQTNTSSTVAPTDIPTDAPPPPTTSPPTMIIPLSYGTMFPGSIAYNPQSQTLFTRGARLFLGRFWYRSVKVTADSIDAYSWIPDPYYTVCPTDPNFVPTGPALPVIPSYDVYQAANRLIYTCDQTTVSTNITLLNYDINTGIQQSIDITQQCDPTKPLNIAVDQAQPDVQYVTCTSSEGCTNVWRASFATGEMVLAMDALDCPNPSSVAAWNNNLVAVCTDHDAIDPATGIRGMGWVTSFNENIGGIRALTNNATCPFPSQVVLAPRQPLFSGFDVYALCADGSVMTPNPWNKDFSEAAPSFTMLLNTTHCPADTSISSFQVNPSIHTLYAVCSPTGVEANNPTSGNTIIKAVVPNVDQQFNNAGPTAIVRAFPTPGCQVTRQLPYSPYGGSYKSIAVDSTTESRVFVMCFDVTQSAPNAVVTVFRDNTWVPNTSLQYLAQARHNPNDLRGNEQFSQDSQASVNAVVGTTSTSGSARFMGLPSAVGISVLVLVVAITSVTGGLLARRIHQRKQASAAAAAEITVGQRV